MCLRFACLAYRRNAGSVRTTCALLPGPSSGEPHGVELQFSTPCGAHAVLYLMRGQQSRQLTAVLCFKGSTLSSPGSAILSDWRANLQVLVPTFSWRSSAAVATPPDVGAGGQLLDGNSAQVHPGFRTYLSELVDAFSRTRLEVLPDDVLAEWTLSGSMSVWQLLQDWDRCAHVLCVGHSLGGAVATMAATLLGASQVDREQGRASPVPTQRSTPLGGGLLAVRDATRRAIRTAIDRVDPAAAKLRSRHRPLLVTFGCPIVGDEAFVQLQNSVVAHWGGLRVFNQLDPIVSCGYGLLSLTTVAGASSSHGGVPVGLRNDALTTANPYTNHLRYCIDSFELIPNEPCARVRYLLPGLVYVPDADATRIAPSPIRGAASATPVESCPKPAPLLSRPLPGMPRRLTAHHHMSGVE
uniref:Fungal lipase-like domain-containing protein n=1 Tax=Coccolithus braarudii TaxID=221442 RepID=A0A7S0Q554_9EUKA